MSDYNFLMESRLSPEQLQVIGHLSRVAADQGLNLYLVGGAVRDLTLGQQAIRDLDFALEGNPERVLRRLDAGRTVRTRSEGFRSTLGEAPPLGVAQLHRDAWQGHAEIAFTNGVRAEFSMCRSEIYSKPGRRPEVAPAMIFDDLKRRDFSANAMAVSLHPNSRGLLLDPTNGAADIEKRELRVLRSCSFLEDPSRIYRLLRLALRLNFKPQERTKQFLDAALENGLWKQLTPDRQGRELRAVLQEQNPGRVLKMLARRGILAGLDKKVARVRVPYECFANTRSAAGAVPRADPFLLNLHCLMEKFGGYKRRLVGNVVLDRKTRNQALALERDARKLVRVLRSARAALPSQVYTLLSREPEPLVLFLLIHYPQAKIQKRVRNYLFKMPQIRTRVPRAELQALGVKPGPNFEKILHRIFLDQLDGTIKTHQQLAKEMRALAGIKEPEKAPAAAVLPHLKSRKR